MSRSLLGVEMDAFPSYVQSLTSVVVARLSPDGIVLEANQGFLLLAGIHETVDRPWQAAPLFIQPSFQQLAQSLGSSKTALLHEGILNLGEPGTTPACLKGTVSRSGEGMLVVAEHDPADWERMRTAVLSLNEELSETQRQLVRDIQARKRAERERAHALEQERLARQAAEEARQLLEQANRDLEETNRGIMTLYAELDDKAQALERASEMKSRFLSNMTHEFRTPLNAILSLARMVLEEEEPLDAERRTQVTFIQKSAETLSILVNDLLDLARIEAGRTPVRLDEFTVPDLFGALRGTLRPLLPKDSSVALVFDEGTALPLLYTDEGKVAQVLRNFIANALKFTERGEVRVSATLADPDMVVFSVADTGIGISPEDQQRIFEEFAQVDGPVQRRSKGTGLGLPLARKLVELLGGKVWIESKPGVGSTFFARIPRRYSGSAEEASGAASMSQEGGHPVR